MASHEQQHQPTEAMRPYELRDLKLGPLEQDADQLNLVETTEFSDMRMSVHGVTKATIRIGGESGYVDAKIIDVSSLPSAIGDDGIVRHKAFDLPDGRNGGYVSGNYILLIPSEDGKRFQARELTPGAKVMLGRNHFDGMPDTVSRNHALVGMDETGQVVVQNQNPTNQTSVHELVKAPEQVLSHDEAIELLSYGDVLDGDAQTAALEYNKANASAQKYAEMLRQICAEQGTAAVKQTAHELLDRMKRTMERIDAPVSKYGESTSWALWDLAKQSFMAKHPEESSPDYLDSRYHGFVGNPFDPSSPEEAERKQAEIVHRHVGWEIAAAIDQGKLDVGEIRKPHWITDRKLESILSTERNATGQLPSSALERLGRNAVGGM